MEKPKMREFDTGATRDADADKHDFEGFLSYYVLQSYATYMHQNRIQSDGALRDSDNWQKGIPRDAYMKSMFRHFMDVWEGHREGQGPQAMEMALNALLFNVMGYQFENLRQPEVSQLASEQAEALLKKYDKPFKHY